MILMILWMMMMMMMMMMMLMVMVMVMVMILMLVMLVMMLMVSTMRAHKARKSSPTFVFLHALAPLAQQLGIQVLDSDKEVVR